jgi:hypothetical protein
MFQGALVQILSEYDDQTSTDFLNFGIGRGLHTEYLAGKIGLVIGMSSMSGMYDVYDILFDDGSIASVEDLRLRIIGTNGKKEDKPNVQSR